MSLISKWNHLSFWNERGRHFQMTLIWKNIPIKKTVCVKKSQAVIVFLKRNQYLTYIIYVERNHFGPEK